MPPIRLALIGLSASAQTNWAATAHLPYLLSPRGRQNYQIVALLNSSEEAAKRAIQHYQLGPHVKAYGSPQALAADPDVDFVVCNTRVDMHYDSVKPSVEAGKAVFVEWPLAENAQRAAELAAVAQKTGAKTVVGLQGRVSPVVAKLREILRQGRIGKVLSSQVLAYSIHAARDTSSEGMAYFLDKKIGGNSVTIAGGHLLDTLFAVLGEYETYHSHTQIQRPQITVRNPETNSTRTVTSDVPDLWSLHGTLQPSHFVAESASLLVNFRKGKPFPGTTPFVWTIAGEKGEIRVTSEQGAYLGSASHESPIPIEVHDFASDEVSEVKWEWEEWASEVLPARGRSTAKLLDLFAQGKLEEAGGAKFEDAVRRHEFMDGLVGLQT